MLNSFELNGMSKYNHYNLGIVCPEYNAFICTSEMSIRYMKIIN